MVEMRTQEPEKEQPAKHQREELAGETYRKKEMLKL